MVTNISILRINGKLHKVVKQTVSGYGGSYATYSKTIPLTIKEEIAYENGSYSTEVKWY